METKSVVKGLAFGGIAGSVAETATFPLDVIKTRMQLQGELGAHRHYKSSIDAAVKILRSEGVTALYKGLSPALVRQVTYGSMRYGLYGPIKRAVDSSASRSTPLRTKVLAGAIAGALAAALCSPIDLVKVRMQTSGMSSAAGSARAYRGLGHAMATIVREEGVTALWRGVGPTCARATALAAAELSTYDHVSDILRVTGPLKDQAPFVRHLAAALAAGFLGALVSSPFDVVKSRVMNQPLHPVTGRGLLYTGTAHCIVQSVRAEGLGSLWKGFWPSFSRIGPRVVIIFVVMEALRDAFD